MIAKAFLVVGLGASLAWGFPTMSFAFGKSHNLRNVDKNYVRDDKLAIVIDKKHKLMYSDGKPSPKMSFQQAQQYCKNLKHAGYTDWYLPTKGQMRSLLNNTRRGDVAIKYAFKNVLEDKYWSGSEANYNKAWYFDYDLGRYGKRKQKYKYRAFCVREMR